MDFKKAQKLVEKEYFKILKIEIKIAEKSKETRVKYSPASIPTCELLYSMYVCITLNCNT